MERGKRARKTMVNFKVARNIKCDRFKQMEKSPRVSSRQHQDILQPALGCGQSKDNQSERKEDQSFWLR